MSEENKQIFDSIDKNDVALLKTLLTNQQDVNILDENNMTPLQHASYKGNRDMVQILLDQGADPNLCEHQNGYTALHFAGLSGNSEVCSLLLMAGAKPHAVNTVSRNPAQMAAFVGNHNCVATINNFVPKSDIAYYTILQGVQTKPYLPPFLVESLHFFVTQINIDPVRVAMNLHKSLGLYDHLEDVKKVLLLMSEREMKRGPETNEILSFKYHYLAFIVNELLQLQKKQSEETADKKTDPLETFSRRMLKTNKEGLQRDRDLFLTNAISSFDYKSCTIYGHMFKTLSGNDRPPALSVISGVVNGQRGFVDVVAVCGACGEEKPAKKCSKCKVVQYCDRECQRLHWFYHKKDCSELEASSKDQEPENKKTNTAEEITKDMQNLLT